MFQSLSRSIEELTELSFCLVNTVNEKTDRRALVWVLKGRISTRPVIPLNTQADQVVCTSEMRDSL